MNARTGLKTIRQSPRGRNGRSRQAEPVRVRSAGATARLTLPLLVLVALSLILAPTSAAAGTHDNHGQSTQLVWSRAMDRNGTVQLVISDARGKGLRELTRPAEGVRDIEASISPDGRLVAFERDYPDNVQSTVPGARSDEMIIGTDGRGEREVPHRLHRPVR